MKGLSKYSILKYLIGKKIDRFEAIQKCLVPRSRHFTYDQRLKSLLQVDDFLATKSSSIRRQFFLFLILIDIVSALFGFRTFRNLSEAKQKKIMSWFFNCPIGLFRKGFWGLNTLAKMGVYSQHGFYEDIGYQLREIPHD